MDDFNDAFKRFKQFYNVEPGFEDGGRVGFDNGGLTTVTANIKGKPVTYQRKSRLGQINTEKRNIIKQFIFDDIEDFEKNLKKFPNEKYELNKTKIVEKLKNNNINTSVETIDEVIKSISPKDKKRFSVNQIGQSSSSILPDNEKNFFAENYKTKNISQMATEITGKPNDNKITKAKTAQLYRHFLTQSKIGNIIKEDLVRGKSKKGTGSGDAFGEYRKAQQNLMNLDPKVYKKLTPAQLDNQLKKALQFSTIKGAFDVPPSLVPSFEHFQGLVPSTITQEPSGLRKVGITTKDYNFNVMGAKAKKGMYKIIKDNIRTSKAFLRDGNIDEAKKSLNTVNQIYDDVAKKLKTIDRKKLPKYSLSKNNIKEINLKAVNLGTEKRLSNTIEDYIRFVAAGPKKDVAKIKQPNLAKAVEMIQKGEDKAVKQLVKSRLPDVRAGQLFAKIPGITELFEMAKSIPGDFKKKAYLKAGFKTLGLGVAPLVIYDTYNNYTQGKPILETLEQGVIGTDIIGGTKRFLALTPKEREARSVVKQDALQDLNIDMPMGFGFIEGPTPQTDLTLEEAQAKAAAGDKRVKGIEAQKNLGRATDRANFFGTIKDRALGAPQEIELAGGGIAKLAGKRFGRPPESGPEEGLASLMKYDNKY